MISFVNRAELDVAKYDDCVENSLQSRVYAFSWYLDIVCDRWGVLILDDYIAVMPIPWRKKYAISYVYPPLWTLELGIYSSVEIKSDQFVSILLEKFKYIELRLNTDNASDRIADQTVGRKMQWISLEGGYEKIVSKYRKDRKKDLTKAKKFSLKEVWQDDPENLITLFKNNIGKRDKNIKEKDYDNLRTLISICLRKKVGEVLSVYNENGQLVAAAFFLLYKKVATILVSSTDLENRKNGANTFLIDKAISKYHEEYQCFNFGGSSIESVASYFKSFGAQDANYDFIKQNNLSPLFKLFRK